MALVTALNAYSAPVMGHVNVFTHHGKVHKIEVAVRTNDSDPISTVTMSLDEAQALLDTLQAAVTTVRERTTEVV